MNSKVNDANSDGFHVDFYALNHRERRYFFD